MKTTRWGPTDAGSTSGSGSAAGPAGGDLGGGYPSPQVTGLDGKPFASPGTEANGDVPTYNSGTGQWDFAPAGASDHKVLVDGSDTTADYLGAKLAAGTGITLTTLSPGGNESIEISAAAGGASGGGFDVTPALSNAMPPWVKPSGSGVITADPQGRVNVNTDTTYKSFPGMAFLEGRLHLVYRQGTAHNSSTGVVKYQTSDDMGRTWTSAATIVTPTAGDDIRDPFIIALSSGRLLLGYDYQTPWNGTPSTFTIKVIYSDNRGQSWSSPYTIPSSAAGNEVAGTSQPVEMPDGSILIFGNVNDTSGGVLYSVLWKSTDGGLTFPTQITVAKNIAVREYAEPQARLLASGNLVCLLRSDTNAHTWRTVSTDGGATWSAPADVLTASSRPDFVEFYPNALILFCRNDNTNFFGRWTVSWDQGLTWTALQNVDGSSDLWMYGAPVVFAPGYLGIAYSIQNSSSDADMYMRWYYDGYGTDPIGNVRALIGSALVSTTAPTTGQVLTATSTSAAAWQTPVGTDTSGWQHVHVENVVFSGDGSTTVFTLPAAPVDAYSVDVYVTGSRSLDWTLSGTLLDTLTFGSAPASAANNIVVDIVAVLV